MKNMPRPIGAPTTVMIERTASSGRTIDPRMPAMRTGPGSRRMSAPVSRTCRAPRAATSSAAAIVAIPMPMNSRMKRGISSAANAPANATKSPSMARTDPATVAPDCCDTDPSRVRTSPSTVVPACRSAVPFTTTRVPVVAPASVAVPRTTTIVSTSPLIRASPPTTTRVSRWSPAGMSTLRLTATRTLSVLRSGSAARATGAPRPRRNAAVATMRIRRCIGVPFVPVSRIDWFVRAVEGLWWPIGRSAATCMTLPAGHPASKPGTRRLGGGGIPSASPAVPDTLPGDHP